MDGFTATILVGSIAQYMPFDVKCIASTTAEGFLKNNEFKGSFVIKYDTTILYPENNLGKCYAPFMQRSNSFELNGEFCVELE